MAKIKENIQLKNLNTFDVQARADYYAEINQKDELKEVITDKNFNSVYTIGGGSNILIKDDIKGLVLKNNIKGLEAIEENNKQVYIKVKSGENWDEFVRYCVKNEYWGVENLALIPGTLGGAILQNAGAYGAEIKDIVTEVNGYNLNIKKEFSFSNSECEFSYRNSIFKQNENELFITSAIFKLNKNGEPNLEYGSLKKELKQKNIQDPSIKDMYDIVCETRKSKLPDWRKTGTAGSFFKNPFINKIRLKELKEDYTNIPYFKTDEGIKLSAGWLIENSEISSKKFDGVQLYPDHSLIIINSGNAKGNAIYNFSEHIKNKVQERFGIELEREVRVW